jgi:hypothetical protein
VNESKKQCQSNAVDQWTRVLFDTIERDQQFQQMQNQQNGGQILDGRRDAKWKPDKGSDNCHQIDGKTACFQERVHGFPAVSRLSEVLRASSMHVSTAIQSDATIRNGNRAAGKSGGHHDTSTALDAN